MSWHRPSGSLSDGTDPIRLDPGRAGWDYSGLHVLGLEAGRTRTLSLPDDEVVLVPVAGSFRVESPVLSVDLTGRGTVFGQLTDRVYLPPVAELSVFSPDGGTVAVATARADRGGPPRHVPAVDTSVELRGAGQASRQINGVFDAGMDGPERVIVVEVLTPAGNWSSYPPHKHDEWGDGEVPLEEIYYFRIDGPSGFGVHRTYTADGEVDETVSVVDGDVYLIPRGFHGPCVAAPGYDMYYLNVMAGPQREWLICTDPEHEWVLGEWESMAIDPRLPMTR